MDNKTNTSLKNIVEGLIFAADEPLTPKQIRDLVEGESSNGSPEAAGLTPQKLQVLVNELNGEYEEEGKPYRIQSIAGGYIFATNSDVSKFVGKLHKEQSRKRLTQAALETLAIIAYKQPITKVELETIRGVHSDYIVKSLLERDLISIVGRQQSAGRPLLYGTTNRFLIHFGLNSIKELPKPREIEELIGETELEVEKRMLELEKKKQEEEEEIGHKRERKPHPLSENATAKIIPLKPDYRPIKKQEPEQEPEPEEKEIPEQEPESRTEPETQPEEDSKEEAKPDEEQKVEQVPEDDDTPDRMEAEDHDREEEQKEIPEEISDEQDTVEVIDDDSSDDEEVVQEQTIDEEAEETTDESIDEPVPEQIIKEEREQAVEQAQPERGWKKWKNKIVKIIKKMFG